MVNCSLLLFISFFMALILQMKEWRKLCLQHLRLAAQDSLEISWDCIICFHKWIILNKPKDHHIPTTQEGRFWQIICPHFSSPVGYHLSSILLFSPIQGKACCALFFCLTSGISICTGKHNHNQQGGPRIHSVIPENKSSYNMNGPLYYILLSLLCTSFLLYIWKHLYVLQMIPLADSRVLLLPW